MQAHVAYGIGLVRLEDDADPRALGENDPALRAGVGFSFEVRPIPALLLPSMRE